MNNTIIFILIGLISGVINGLTGLGHAGAILICLTLSGTIKSYDTMVGTALYSQLFPVVAFGVWEFYKRKQIDFYAGNVIIGVLLFSVFIGSWLKQYISSKYTKIVTALLLLLTAFKFLQDVYNE
jgi:uncharacterized membrane protein YfcA